MHWYLERGNCVTRTGFGGLRFSTRFLSLLATVKRACKQDSYRSKFREFHDYFPLITEIFQSDDEDYQMRPVAGRETRKEDIEFGDIEPKITMCNLIKPLLSKVFTEPPSSALRNN